MFTTISRQLVNTEFHKPLTLTKINTHTQTQRNDAMGYTQQRIHTESGMVIPQRCLYGNITLHNKRHFALMH